MSRTNLLRIMKTAFLVESFWFFPFKRLQSTARTHFSASRVLDCCMLGFLKIFLNCFFAALQRCLECFLSDYIASKENQLFFSELPCGIILIPTLLKGTAAFSNVSLYFPPDFLSVICDLEKKSFPQRLLKRLSLFLLYGIQRLLLIHQIYCGYSLMLMC